MSVRRKKALSTLSDDGSYGDASASGSSAVLPKTLTDGEFRMFMAPQTQGSGTSGSSGTQPFITQPFFGPHARKA